MVKIIKNGRVIDPESRFEMCIRDRSSHETVKTDINSGAGGTASAAGPRTFSGCMAGAGCREKACIRDGSFGS